MLPRALLAVYCCALLPRALLSLDVAAQETIKKGAGSQYQAQEAAKPRQAKALSARTPRSAVPHKKVTVRAL